MADAPTRHDPVPSAPLAHPGVTVALAPPARRWSLRTRTPEGLPEAMLTAAPYAGGTALKLGPDEWLLLLAPDAPTPAIAGVHALVDVSERSCALTVTGGQAPALLATGCPLDLVEPAFPIGRATRTLFEGVEIVLWRQAPDRFRVEVWKSFAPWLWDALALNAGELQPAAARTRPRFITTPDPSP